MITKQQYIEALELIDNYHRQNDGSPLKNEAHKTELNQWIGSLKNISVRLKNILAQYGYYANKSVVHVEDITEFHFMRIRNSGVKSWEEFQRLRGY